MCDSATGEAFQFDWSDDWATIGGVFPDLKALNNWLEDRCKVLWAETAHGSLPGSIANAWEAEKAALMPLPTAFDGFLS